MPKLLFEPVINKVGEDEYIIVPKSESTNVRCAMKCNGVAAYIVSLMYPNHIPREDMGAMVLEHFPDLYATEEEAQMDVNSVISIMRGGTSATSDGGTTEGEEVTT